METINEGKTSAEAEEELRRAGKAGKIEVAVEEADRGVADTAVAVDRAVKAEARAAKDPTARQVEGESAQGRADAAAAAKVKVAEERMSARAESEAAPEGLKESCERLKWR